MARKKQSKKQSEAKLLEEARVLADRAVMVHRRHDVLQVIMGRASEAVRKRLETEALVRQDEFLEALYAGAKFVDLDEEAKLFVSPLEGVPPPALAAPPLSPFLQPVVYDWDQVERFEFEWVWHGRFVKVVLHREVGIARRAVNIAIRVFGVRGFERVAMGTVYTPYQMSTSFGEEAGMWARLYVLQAPVWRPGAEEAVAGVRAWTGPQSLRKTLYLWCVLMAGYEVAFTELELQPPSVSQADLERAAEGLIELRGAPGPGRQMVCRKPVLEALR